MRFLSACSGIEAATQAFGPFGWTPLAYAEIEPFPAAVLAYRHGATRPRVMPDPEQATDPKDKAERAADIRALERVPYWGDRIVNQGDFTTLKDEPELIVQADVLCAGTPCQTFSIAGLRAGLADDRGNLTLQLVVLADAIDDLRLHTGKPPLIVIWENVPGILSHPDNPFGCFLAALVGADAALVPPRGQRWTSSGMVAGPRRRAAWTVKDAQYFGLPQRRERVVVVASARDDLDPSAVLFEPEGVRRYSPPSREQGERPSATLRASLGKRCGEPDGASEFDSLVPTQRRTAFGGNRTDGELAVATARSASASASGRMDFESETFIVEPAHTLRGEGFDASEDGTGRGTPLVPVHTALRARDTAKGVDSDCTDTLIPVAFNSREDPCTSSEVFGSLGSSSPQAQAIAFTCKDYGADAGPISPTMRAMGHSGSHANAGGQVAVAYGISSDALDRSGEGAGRSAGERSGLGIVEDLAPTLKARTNAAAVAFSLRGRDGENSAEAEPDGISPALRAVGGGSSHSFVAFQGRGSNIDLGQDVTGTVGTNMDRASGGAPCIASDMAVRRITCVEAETLQGFPPNHTLIPWPTANRKGDDLAETIAYLHAHGYGADEAAELAQTPDGPRYKAIGNSWAVDMFAWVGRRTATCLQSDGVAA